MNDLEFLENEADLTIDTGQFDVIPYMQVNHLPRSDYISIYLSKVDTRLDEIKDELKGCGFLNETAEKLISDLEKSIEKTCSDYYKKDTDLVKYDSLEETLDYLIWDWNDLISDFVKKELVVT